MNDVGSKNLQNKIGRIPKDYLFRFVIICCLYSEVENYSIFYYGKPYTRYGPFLIGILTGIYLTTKTERLLKKKVRTSKTYKPITEIFIFYSVHL